MQESFNLNGLLKQNVSPFSVRGSSVRMNSTDSTARKRYLGWFDASWRSSNADAANTVQIMLGVSAGAKNARDCQSKGYPHARLLEYLDRRSIICSASASASFSNS